MVRRRTLRVVHAKGVGAHGYFGVTTDVMKCAGWQSQHKDKGKVRVRESTFSLQGRQNLCGMEDRVQHRGFYQVHVN